MNILTMKRLRDYYDEHADSKIAIQEWAAKVQHAEWETFEDIKRTFNSVDYIGNDRYVFNIKGNKYRIIAKVIFKIRRTYIRFIGTHAQYSKLKKANDI